MAGQGRRVIKRAGGAVQKAGGGLRNSGFTGLVVVSPEHCLFQAQLQAALGRDIVHSSKAHGSAKMQTYAFVLFASLEKRLTMATH
jgi:hypothetical protein